MEIQPRRKTPVVKVASVVIGGGHPIVIQSMTNTRTADVQATVHQIIELIEAGSEMVRVTVNNDEAARAVPEIIRTIRDQGYLTPIIGDFHFNGHILLSKHPECARLLDKYRVNPGNIGKGHQHDENFARIIKIAVENSKAVRIGVNWGSLDQELVTDLMNRNARIKSPKNSKEIIYNAMIQSALQSAELAERIGLPSNRIVLSVKMSVLQDMVAVYSRLAARCDYALHLGLTEAGGDIQGVASSSAALAILLQQGIGDTIRVSLTPQPNVGRSREVEVCRHLLQALGLRYFEPSVTSCPGCGRTASDYFQHLARDISGYIHEQMPRWKDCYPGVERMKIAVMGCVVNGPGESRHADIGISLPGAFEKSIAPVYVDGKQLTTLKGEHIKEEFIGILEDYMRKKFTRK
ncbi:MAG: 4-hydroxy-3-methylbut-2-en-1-yl diphosphate synthase [Omnitrophica WOR_2 bacterium RIFCSPHIGHO2_02_FULL_50_17]|nr:MAG: 4-hydroxy-3-methylbut-2-en-1-yl diphosphate synthase [Omnitrophica WOR_2 bacterium RIFCSPHIGHO2_02_FULL_50_17]